MATTPTPPAAPGPLPTPQILARVLPPIGVGAVWWLGWLAHSFVCLPTLLWQGAAFPECPDGELLPALNVSAHLQRGQPGHVRVGMMLQGISEQGWELSASTTRFRPSLSLRREGSPESEPGDPLPMDGAWDEEGDAHVARARLPQDLPDGEHTLVATAGWGGQTVRLELPLPVYAPASVHLLSDRPLYEPGHEVQLRAVALRARDRVPLAERSGRLQVVQPDGTLVMDEAARTDGWGVVVGSFPIAPGAPEGTWTARWVSGDDAGELRFDVRPFTLPRFTARLQPSLGWAGPGDTPQIVGEATYASGAPVGGAEVELRWRVDGAWQPPQAWIEDALPTAARTDARGRFTVALPAVPADLVGPATLVAEAAFTDPAGDRQAVAAQLLLFEDDIEAEALTEYGGLVDGVNNRVWVRVRRPGGAPLAGAALKVRRAWDPQDPGVDAIADEDGVVALQLDPGPPVNIELPTPPVRPPRRPPPVALLGLDDPSGRRAPGLDERQAVEALQAPLAACAAALGVDSVDLRVAIEVDPSGALRSARAGGPPSRAGACAERAVQRLRLAPGGDRLLLARWQLHRPDLPLLRLRPRAALGDGSAVDAALQDAAGEASRCLPPSTSGGSSVASMRWSAGPGTTEIGLRMIPDDSRLSPEAARCVLAAIGPVRLGQPLREPSVGLVELDVVPAAAQGELRAEPQVQLGYALQVAAAIGDVALGQTTLRLSPGQLPRLRLRAEPPVAAPGESVEIRMVRGPDFHGELPEELILVHANGTTLKAKVDPERRAARFALPADAAGWWTATALGERALLFVPPDDQIDLTLRVDRPAYAPGDTATLQVEARRGGAGVEASVGLFGVDTTLATLAPLPGPDALGALRPAPDGAPVLGGLDGVALVAGLVRGAAAREAVLRTLSGPPPLAALDRPVSAFAATALDPQAELISVYYGVLGEAHAAARRWHAEAPERARLTPEVAAQLWDEALRAVAASGRPTRDAYGRTLRLHRLPPDLLELASPRSLAPDGARLPEDLEPWAAWVHEERP